MYINKQKGIECVEMADKLLAQIYKENIEYFEAEKYISEKDNKANQRLIGSQLGLVCEYYLKGIILPTLKVEAPEDDEVLKQIVSELSEKEKYEILIGNTGVLDDLSHRYNITKKRLKALTENSLKNLGHDLKTLVEKLGDSENLKIMLAFLNRDSKKSTFDGMNIEGLNLFFSGEVFKDLITSMPLEQIDSENMHSVEKRIDSPKVKNAFASGRYGHLDSYIPDTKFLFKLAEAIREEISKVYLAVDLQYTNLESIERLSNRRYIFPDEDSKIYVFGDGKQITRTYEVKRYQKYIEEHEFSNPSLKAKGDERHHLWLEYGYSNAEKVATQSTINMNTLCPIHNTLTIINEKREISPTIICKIDGQYINYVFSKTGKIYEAYPNQNAIEQIEAYEKSSKPSNSEKELIEASIESQLLNEILLLLSMMRADRGMKVDKDTLELISRPTFEQLEKRVKRKRIFEAICDKCGIKKRLLDKLIGSEKGDSR